MFEGWSWGDAALIALHVGVTWVMGRRVGRAQRKCDRALADLVEVTAPEHGAALLAWLNADIERWRAMRSLVSIFCLFLIISLVLL